MLLYVGTPLNIDAFFENAKFIAKIMLKNKNTATLRAAVFLFWSKFVTNYLTFIEDFQKVLDFIEWYRLIR
jgi:hypothetical protein